MPVFEPSAADTPARLRALLSLYQEWGVDCALDPAPRDRATPAPSRTPTPPASPSASSPGPVRTTPQAAMQAPAVDAPDEIATAADFPVLLAALERVPQLTLARTATHTLAPIHVPQATLMIVGEPPDSDEDRTGVLFGNASGALLARMLGSVGIALDSASRAACIPWRPPGGRDATEAERTACAPALLRAIALCAPKIVLTLGPTPARMLLGESVQLTRVRGRWSDIAATGTQAPIRILPMRHPAQVVTSPQARKDAWRDLLTLADALEAPTGPDAQKVPDFWRF